MDDDYNNPVVELERKALYKRIQEDRANLTQLGSASVQTMPEDIFVYYFLPMFAGEDVPNASRLIADWQRTAGSPWMPVNIVDKAGNVVAQIPALRESEWFTPDKDSKNNLDYQMFLAKQKAAVSPRLAQAMMVDALSNKVEELTSKVNPENYLAKWQTLLSRYGKSLPGRTENKAAGQTEIAKPQAELEVDDWGG